MYDLHVQLNHVPGTLGAFGEVMGAAGVSLEGGGVFSLKGRAHAHFLVADGEQAREVAIRAGLNVVAVKPVLVRRLDQERPGELGAICRALGEAGINLETMYSDHANQLILVIEGDRVAAERVTLRWAP